MKQKNTPVKKQANGAGLKNKLKKNKTNADEVAAKKVAQLRKEIEEHEEKEEAEDSDSGADVEGDQLVGNEVDEDEEDENDDDDEDDDDKEEDEDDKEEDDEDESEEANAEAAADDDSDDEPVEAPIAKKEANKTNKIKTGNMPKTYPGNRLVIVRNLTKNAKQKDIVEIFEKYGVIDQIQTQHTPTGTTVTIGYTTAAAAQSALAADKATIKGATIQVSSDTKAVNKQKKVEAKIEKKNKIIHTKDLTVYVNLHKRTTTMEQTKEHFTACGEIQSFVFRPRASYALITFSQASEVEAALKLNNSVLNGATIRVSLKAAEPSKPVRRDAKNTILLKNPKQLDTVSLEKLSEIFSKCGEVANIDLLCSKNIIGFIEFKNEKSVTKALKLNGTTAEGIELDLEECKPQLKTKIFMQNVKPGVTEDQVKEFFANTGAIEDIYIKHGFAIVKFADTEGFCKSFLLNENMLAGQMVFLEPYSDRKKVVLKQHSFKPGNKRPMPHKHNANAKRFKKN